MFLFTLYSAFLYLLGFKLTLHCAVTPTHSLKNVTLVRGIRKQKFPSLLQIMMGTSCLPDPQARRGSHKALLSNAPSSGKKWRDMAEGPSLKREAPCRQSPTDKSTRQLESFWVRGSRSVVSHLCFGLHTSAVMKKQGTVASVSSSNEEKLITSLIRLMH